MTTEATYNFESSDLEGSIHRVDLTQQSFSGALQWRNHLTVKGSTPRDTLALSYQRNYLRDRLDLYTTGSWYHLNVFGGLDAYSNENLSTSIAGWPGQYRNDLGLSGGGAGEFRFRGFTLKGNSEYSEMRYEVSEVYIQDSLVVLPDNPIDRNLSLFGELEYTTRLGIRPYMQLDHYNDLNASDVGNQTWYRLGARYQKRFNAVWYLASDLAVGTTDYLKDHPNFFEVSERVTTRFNLNWMLVNRLEGSMRMDDSMGDPLTGNSFFESMVQYSLNTDAVNRTNRVQFGLKSYSDGYSALRGNLQAHFGRYLFFADAHDYLGDKPIRKSLVELQAGADIGPLRITGGVRNEQFRKRDNANSVILQLGYLQR
jgi:hypothetical protein